MIEFLQIIETNNITRIINRTNPSYMSINTCNIEYYYISWRSISTAYPFKSKDWELILRVSQIELKSIYELRLTKYV